MVDNALSILTIGVPERTHRLCAVSSQTAFAIFVFGFRMLCPSSSITRFCKSTPQFYLSVLAVSWRTFQCTSKSPLLFAVRALFLLGSAPSFLAI